MMLIVKLTNFLLDSSKDAFYLNTKHIVMDFIQKGNICKCKTRHTSVGEKKRFHKGQQST